MNDETMRAGCWWGLGSRRRAAVRGTVAGLLLLACVLSVLLPPGSALAGNAPNPATAPALTPAAAIEARYQQLGGPAGVLGPPTSPVVAVPRGYRRVYAHGHIYYSPATSAWEVLDPFLAYYLGLGASASALGLPTSAAYTSGRGARVQNFYQGRVYWTPATGARSVYGPTLARYLALGGSAGSMGIPTVTEHAGKQPGVRVTGFSSGQIWYSPGTGAREVRGAVLAKYLRIGAEASWIGVPTGYMRGTSYGYRQDFQHASLQDLHQRRAVYIRLPFSTSVRTPRAGDLPYTYRSGCPVPPSGLRMISVPFRRFDGDDHWGLIVVRADVVRQITLVFKNAHANWWVIRQVRRVDKYRGSDEASMAADNTSAFNCRKVTGNPYKLSQHSYGNAIDINTFENPYVTPSRVYPPGSATYLDRGNVRPGMIVRGDPVERTMRELGWPWGARWAYPDYQHFSSNGG